jgi:prepilin-type N-terminal cleavage/methylation domain-containing protein
MQENSTLNHTARHRRSGFTLVEIAVVVLLAGILGALMLPRLDVGRYKADSVVTTVRTALQQAQRASLVSQHDIIVSFDLTGNRVRLAWDANNNHVIDPTERTTWTPLSSGNRFAVPPLGIHGATGSAISGSNVREMDGLRTVTFHRDGSLSSELEIYMSTAGSPTRWRAVTVVQATGRTDWYRKSTTGNTWVAGVL